MNWKIFLESVFCGDHAVIDFVQRLMGYAASGDKTLRLIAVLYSLRPSGKTTFFRALHHALGGEIVFGGSTVLDLSRSIDLPSPSNLMLSKSSMVVFTGINRCRKPGLSARLKMLAADEMVVARKPFQNEPTVFRNSATPFLLQNEIPSVFSKQPALSERTVFVEFPAVFAPGDPSVPAALAADRQAICAWLEEGTRRWHSEGLTISDRFRLPAQNKRRAA